MQDAVLYAMGPTYFWYQFEELEKLGNKTSAKPTGPGFVGCTTS
jgi:hypothetical protein